MAVQRTGLKALVKLACKAVRLITKYRVRMAAEVSVSDLACIDSFLAAGKCLCDHFEPEEP